MSEEIMCTGKYCKNILTESVAKFSMQKYSTLLCFSCQKKFDKIQTSTPKSFEGVKTGTLEVSDKETKAYGEKMAKELNIKSGPSHALRLKDASMSSMKETTPVKLKAVVDPKHIISLQGKQFITHSGLLAMTHKLGIRSVNTDIISDLTSETVICKTTLTLKDGRVFTGLGDANKENTNAMVGAHKIRMSETRSFNRAMRFATNTGLCSVDELGEMKKSEPEDFNESGYN